VLEAQLDGAGEEPGEIARAQAQSALDVTVVQLRGADRALQHLDDVLGLRVHLGAGVYQSGSGEQGHRADMLDPPG
jgi:hypothetical protein